jgi:hypothetical protein
MSTLNLKWGTLKAWDFSDCPEAATAEQEYVEIGASAGAMQQRDTPRQKELICKMIDAVTCEIRNEWSGETMTKNQAKEYVLNY